MKFQRNVDGFSLWRGHYEITESPLVAFSDKPVSLPSNNGYHKAQDKQTSVFLARIMCKQPL